MKRLAILLALIFTLSAGNVLALDPPPAPTDIPIVDQTDTLSTTQKTQLAQKIADERTATGNQIAILMIPSLEGDSLEGYSLKVARTWGVGQKDRNSGVLLLIAKDDRRLRIEVGYGLEGALPDARAAQIIRDRITPSFREGKFYEGIDSGLTGIITAIHGEADTSLQQTQPDWITIAIFIFAFGMTGLSWIAAILARSKSWWAGGILGGISGTIIGLLAGFVFIGIIAIITLFLLGLLLDYLVSKNFRSAVLSGSSPSWWAGGGNSGGGGGFGGFSGGSFGGGGASGSW